MPGSEFFKTVTSKTRTIFSMRVLTTFRNSPRGRIRRQIYRVTFWVGNQK